MSVLFWKFRGSDHTESTRSTEELRVRKSTRSSLDRPKARLVGRMGIPLYLDQLFERGNTDGEGRRCLRAFVRTPESPAFAAIRRKKCVTDRCVAHPPAGSFSVSIRSKNRLSKSPHG